MSRPCLVSRGPEEKVKALFESADFKVSLQKDIYGWLFNHYIMNAAMEAQVVKYGSFKNVVLSTDALAGMLMNIKEMVPYIKAKNIKVDTAVKG
ncbi:MAG: hypothetical protein IKN54_02710 [Lachnospiraceae bacterium]|nr:hypothetical protein [Lachnospiraceae bacterium]